MSVFQNTPNQVAHEASPSPPYISVVVPVRNEGAHLANTLEQLLQQEYDPKCFEVVVVDGESTDGTRAIVRAFQGSHANVRLYHNPRQLSSSARNIGVCQARGDLLVIVDGHCDLRNPCYLQNLADAFARSEADCLGRPQPLDVTGATLLQKAIAVARSCWLGHHPRSWVYSSEEQFVPPQSVGVAYRRSVFEKVGLFDESFDACEDVDFNHRVDKAGLRCFFTPKVQVFYQPRPRLAGLFRQMVRYARGRMRLLRKHPETFSIACFVPIFFLLGLITGPFLALIAPQLGALYLATLALYGALVLTASCQVAVRGRDLRLVPILPLVFCTIHLGTGAGGIAELLCWLGKGRPRFVLKTMPRAAIVSMAQLPQESGTPVTVALEGALATIRDVEE